MTFINYLILPLSFVFIVEVESRNFPKQYLELDDRPVPSDIDQYVGALNKLSNYRLKHMNDTDGSLALGSYLAVAILTRTLEDYKGKMDSHIVVTIKTIINNCFQLFSHFEYQGKFYFHDSYIRSLELGGITDRLGLIALSHSIGKFNRNRLAKWILTDNNPINNYTYEIDNISLERIKYVDLIYALVRRDYFIGGNASDECLLRLSRYEVITPKHRRQPCPRNDYCRRNLFRDPSIAYSLSHRMLNIAMPYMTRRCYYNSEDDDLMQVDRLCAEMYRETVYIARRGFFARDMFIEHIALCSLLGYEEFHRRRWQQKLLSWITEPGCLAEHENFAVYYYYSPNAHVGQQLTPEEKLRKSQNLKKNNCVMHLTAVGLPMLASAIRYAAHHL